MESAYTPVKRLDELDSLRGLAALTVVLRHLCNLWLGDEMYNASEQSRRAFILITSPFTTGHEAVLLFFMLSGFVLALPFIAGKPQSYPVFATRRIFRIYLPYLVVLSLAVFGDYFLHGQITRSQWFNNTWSRPVDWHLVGQHILFLGQYKFDQFNPPIWSLIYEMRISLIFPFLCALVLRFTPSLAFVAACGISLASMIGDTLFASAGISFPLTGTLHYSAFFILGICLARQRAWFASVYRGLSRAAKILFVVVIALLFVGGSDLWSAVFDGKLTAAWVNSSDWPPALGAFGLIVLCLNSRTIKRILYWGPVKTLGRMSYSVYLTHFVVLLTLIHLFYGRLPLLAILCLCLAVTLVVSAACYRWVELPCMNLGRRLSALFS